MDSKRSAVTIIAVIVAAAVMVGRAESPGLQLLLQNLPVCTAPPSPYTDTWPVAAIDVLGPTAGPLTFTGASLVVGNNTSAQPLTAGIPVESATTQCGVPVSGTG